MSKLEKISEGDTVESIYTGKQYTVVAEREGLLQVIAIDSKHSTLSVAASDFKKVV